MNSETLEALYVTKRFPFPMILILLLSAAQAMGQAGDGTTDFDRYWFPTATSGGRYAEFIPEALLQQGQYRELGLDIQEIEDVEWILSNARLDKQRLGKAPCTRSAHGQTRRRPPREPESLLAFLRRRVLVARGEVVAVVEGLRRGSVQTLVYLQAKQILQCRQASSTRTVWIGDTISFAVQKGTILVDGETLCNATDEPLVIPEVGSSVLVAGWPEQPGPHFMGTGVILPILDEEVHSQPYLGLPNFQPTAYASIATQLGGATEFCAGDQP